MFSNKEITMKEKRLLTKFIQYIYDLWVQQEEEERPIYINEINLQQVLSSPWFDELGKITLSTSEQAGHRDLVRELREQEGLYGDIPERAIQAGWPMHRHHSVLQFTAQPFHRYSLCFADTRTTFVDKNGEVQPLYVETAIERLFLYISSQRIYSNTSFIYPLYGCNSIIEVCFCHSRVSIFWVSQCPLGDLIPIRYSPSAEQAPFMEESTCFRPLPKPSFTTRRPTRSEASVRIYLNHDVSSDGQRIHLSLQDGHL